MPARTSRGRARTGCSRSLIARCSARAVLPAEASSGTLAAAFCTTRATRLPLGSARAAGPLCTSGGCHRQVLLLFLLLLLYLLLLRSHLHRQRAIKPSTSSSSWTSPLLWRMSKARCCLHSETSRISSLWLRTLHNLVSFGFTRVLPCSHLSYQAERLGTQCSTARPPQPTQEQMLTWDSQQDLASSVARPPAQMRSKCWSCFLMVSKPLGLQ